MPSSLVALAILAFIAFQAVQSGIATAMQPAPGHCLTCEVFDK